MNFVSQRWVRNLENIVLLSLFYSINTKHIHVDLYFSFQHYFLCITASHYLHMIPDSSMRSP